MKAQVESLKTERDKYRDHRDYLAGIVSNKVIDVMEQHMNDANISESFLQTNNDHSQDRCEDVKMDDSSAEIPTIGINCKLNSNNRDDRLAS